MTYNATALKERIKLLEIELDRLKMCLEQSDLPDEPIFDNVNPNFITFQKRFGKSSGRFYTYAAVGLYPDRWFITGRKPAEPTSGMKWAELMDFMVAEESVSSRPHVIATYRVLR